MRHSLMQTIGLLVNSVLRRVGFRLQRISPGHESDARMPSGFYKPSSSCQIPELATLYRLFLGERSDGLFVEVGAYDGISFSNSSCLAEMGWHGILIEPIPQFAQACRNRYRGNSRIEVIETAIGATNTPVEITVAGCLTTTNNALVAGYRTIDWAKASVKDTTVLTVSQRSLDDVLAASSINKPIDVLIVDVEGAESSVFAGFTVERWRPRMIIAELSHTHPDLHSMAASDAGLQRQIEGWGYSIVYKDAINTVFCCHDEAMALDV